VLLGGHPQPVVAARRVVDGIALAAETVDERLGDHRFVFHHEDPHRCIIAAGHSAAERPLLVALSDLSASAHVEIGGSARLR
jgi:hypothetical protein